MADTITSAAASQATATSTAKSATDRAMIAENFDAFLLLLTTQLKNQSPLDPMDTNQFTQQLVQFASVEQQLKSNDTLNALLTSARAIVRLDRRFLRRHAGHGGRQDDRALPTARPQWRSIRRRAAQASVTIMDRSGSVVPDSTKIGAGRVPEVIWDGRTRPAARRRPATTRSSHRARRLRPERVRQDRDRRPGRMRRRVRGASRC